MSTVTGEGGDVVVKPDIDITASMADEFMAELKQVIGGGVDSLTIDLSTVEVIDSMGLGVMVAAHNTLKKNNSKLKLVNASNDILNLLNKLRLDYHFEII